jgi:hypothetical protein
MCRKVTPRPGGWGTQLTALSRAGLCSDPGSKRNNKDEEAES